MAAKQGKSESGERGKRHESDLLERNLGIRRVAKVVKGGRIFRFSAAVVVGNGKGKAGLGVENAREVPVAIQKAIEAAKRNMVQIELNGDTIYREARLKHGATQVYMKPAAEGTGIIAGGAMRALFEVLGIKNILAKSLYSRNSINVVRATLKALQEMESPEYVAYKRGIPLEQLMGEIDG